MLRRITLLAAVVTALMAPGVAAASPTAVAFQIDRDFGAGTDLWSASGAISDGGTFVDDPFVFAGSSSVVQFSRTMTGSDGTITLRCNARLLATDDPDVIRVSGRWAVVSGTGAYATARGSGVVEESFDTAAGTITGIWTGGLAFAP